VPQQFPPRTALEIEGRSRRLNIEAETANVVAEIKQSAVSGAKDLPDDERLGRFIGIVGVAEVRAALATTTKRLDRHARGEASPIEFPWDYLVAVVNERPARLRYLYLMLYLWETTLRSLINRTLTAAKGDEWHKEPRNYLTPTDADRMLAKHAGVSEVATGRAGEPGATYRIRTDCPAGLDFLNELDLWVIHAILLDSWEVFGPLMKGRRPHAMPYGPARILFDGLYRTRYYVMHVQPLDNEAFLGAVDHLRTALAMVGVNHELALERIKRREQQMQDSVLQGAGGFATQRLPSTPLRQTD
jgi:hypothetical protein